MSNSDALVATIVGSKLVEDGRDWNMDHKVDKRVYDEEQRKWLYGEMLITL